MNIKFQFQNHNHLTYQTYGFKLMRLIFWNSGYKEAFIFCSNLIKSGQIAEVKKEKRNEIKERRIRKEKEESLKFLQLS